MLPLWDAGRCPPGRDRRPAHATPRPASEMAETGLRAGFGPTSVFKEDASRAPRLSVGASAGAAGANARGPELPSRGAGAAGPPQEAAAWRRTRRRRGSMPRSSWGAVGRSAAWLTGRQDALSAGRSGRGRSSVRKCGLAKNGVELRARRRHWQPGTCERPRRRGADS